MYFRALQLTALALIASPGLAAGTSGQAIVDAIARLGLPQAVDQIGPAPLAGFVEIVSGTRVLYVSTDGETVIDGEIVSLGRGVNLTEEARAAARLRMIAAVPSSDRIIVRPQQAPEHRVLVFTDTDCPYCRRLHEHLDDYLRAGIEVDYAFYPRAGPQSDAFARAVAVWCAADRVAALTAGFAGGPVAGPSCSNPVARHYDLALRLGLRGTPALIAEDGSVLYGYVSAAELIERLDVQAPDRAHPVSR